MTRSAFREAVLLWALWLVPGILLLLYGRLRPDDPSPVPDDPEPGYRWLALPAIGLGKPAWIGGWKNLSVAKSDDNPEPVPAPVAPVEIETEKTAPEGEPPFRIRLVGQVLDGTRVLYCFFDTEDQRWFRMAGGGVDPEAGIRLETTPGDNQPLVTDLADGRRYILSPGEPVFKRLDPDFNAEAKGIE
jgi:hypothetical protein